MKATKQICMLAMCIYGCGCGLIITAMIYPMQVAAEFRGSFFYQQPNPHGWIAWQNMEEALLSEKDEVDINITESLAIINQRFEFAAQPDGKIRIIEITESNEMLSETDSASSGQEQF